ncbi:hypothetical protein NSK11_contig00007-0056 [Nocardia seriolae]|uniref:Uncharacterized protein n=1 Tax=Nocardia seriolae TaxID=37332 RepID=A0ABC9YMA5_9NOCA|nr:hypothetical protein NSERKGN1266_46590 [Nocardia seriolae]BEK96459.1 hypothetical protein NSER024013_43650 [Nocardia seriolae]GAM44553.1 hypothetical protein NS07_v2contig00005-0056 [Nocardia seriolae]GAP26572.1 hypothetical protein NSK11_contig00007-0056 [Nocardia seriolae]GEM22135.1 hypothetical protein NS2_03740 [Nocardia seriolae NBRC 15557]
MRIVHSSRGAQPFEKIASERVAAKGGAGNWFGVFSIQKFVDQNALSYTHADADGWYSYLSKFKTGNFRFEDAGVVVCEFIEGTDDWDDWQDTYGLDACKSIYYSGHGTMDGNGVFSIRLGGRLVQPGPLGLLGQHGDRRRPHPLPVLVDVSVAAGARRDESDPHVGRPGSRLPHAVRLRDHQHRQPRLR